MTPKINLSDRYDVRTDSPPPPPPPSISNCQPLLRNRVEDTTNSLAQKGSLINC